MIDIFLQVIFAILKSVFFFFVVPWLLYHRVYDYFRSQAHYGPQEIVWQVPGVWGSWPFIGSLLTVLQVRLHQIRNGLNNHVIDGLVNMFGDSFKPVTLCYFTCGTTVLIADPLVVEAMYTSKNKYFDKHPIIKDLTLCLTGRSILFAETTREWKEARKTISPAFYKGKLVGLVEIARESVRVSVDKLKKLTASSGKPKTQLDMINEFNSIFVRILLTTALGEDVSERQVNYWENGKLIKVNVAYSLRETFHHLAERMAHVHIFFFPFLADVYLTPSERAMKANAGFLRDLIKEIVDRRRVAIANDPKLKEAGDFLTILLTEPFFMNDHERIIDECLTFFFAGS